ncbi:MAG: hypothetical protein MJ174_09610 [Treponema sp.]|nr:hypothetical protein [Treponema sp.]
MKTTAFSYKQGNSFLHKMPPVLKILIIPLLNILFLNLPFYFTLSLLSCQFVLSFILGFTLKEQFKDLKPVIYYGFLLYGINFLVQIISSLQMGQTNLQDLNPSIWISIKQSAIITFSNYETLFMLIKLFCVIQSCSIIFRTSTTLQIRQGIGQIETFIRKYLPVSKKNRFTDTLSLFFCFIPLVYKNWEQCKRAWFARGGKQNIRMYKSIFPVFFSVGIRQAWYTSRAMLIREE